jgi:hypothetical protein
MLTHEACPCYSLSQVDLPSWRKHRLAQSTVGVLDEQEMAEMAEREAIVARAAAAGDVEGLERARAEVDAAIRLDLQRCPPSSRYHLPKDDLPKGPPFL